MTEPMSSFDYFVCEFVYEAAIQSYLPRPLKKEIVELQYILAKEDIRKLKLEEKYEIN